MARVELAAAGGRVGVGGVRYGGVAASGSGIVRFVEHHNHEGTGVVYCSGCGYEGFDPPLCGCQCPRHHEVKEYGCQVEASERTNARMVQLDGRSVLMCRSCAEAWALMKAREVG